MTVQSSYLDRLPTAYEGMIDSTEPCVLISRTVEGAALSFGKAVKQGSDDRGVAAATAAADVYRGISVRDQSADPSNANAFSVGESARIMTQGVVWVKLGATVAAGAAVYMIAADGRFTSSAGSNLAIPDAVFDASGVANDLVPIRLR